MKDGPKDQLKIRLGMKDYLKTIFREAHEDGSTLLRAMFYEFPEDEKCWDTDDQYMFGDEYLVAPIIQLNCFEREVYLPAGKWILTSDDTAYEGGQKVSVKAPIDYMPVLKRA